MATKMFPLNTSGGVGRMAQREPRFFFLFISRRNSMLGPFPIPHNFGVESFPKSVMELRLNAFSAVIRSKHEWHIKRRDPNIVEKWQADAIAQHITPEQFKYVIDELEYYDKLRNGSVEVADVDGVWKAPQLFPQHLCSEFARHLARLTDILDSHKDWHPGSNEVVLDVIHPGLYLFVSGKTRTIKPDHANCPNGLPTTLPQPEIGFNQFTSTDYQWIPTPVEVDKEGKVTFLSYVNNLHPIRHKDLYPVLADMFSLTLPLFERVLTFLKSPLNPKFDLGRFEIYETQDEPDKREDEDYDAYDRRLEDWYQNRPINPIPIPTFTEPSTRPSVVLRSCRLQVIVKIQEIHLTPDRPVYEGGVWHVEGMRNERIVATAIYYYDCSNITECKLSFRQAVGEPDYDQDDHRGVEAVWGLSDGEPLVQTLGSVITKASTSSILLD